jgi:uncharacterized protein (DUF779 family)
MAPPITIHLSSFIPSSFRLVRCTYPSLSRGKVQRMEVRATPQAEAVVRKVAGSGREDLVMVLGTGCCDSTAPFLYDRYYPGPDVLEVGRVADVPVFAHRWLADLYSAAERLEVDADRGVINDSFSLESEHDARFTLRVADPR